MRVQFSQLWNRLRLAAVVASAAFLLMLSPAALRAESNAYGCGDYSTDNYNSVCPASNGSSTSTSGTAASSSVGYESTVVQASSGLEVAINLADGQEIPYAGYNITITPLKSDGVTFDKAEIYLDGKLVFTGSPDSTGTLKWLWEPSKLPGTKVKIIIYGPGSGTTTHEFNVTIGKDLSTTTTPTTTETDNSVTNTPATSAFPWWGYLLIGLLILLLLILIIWLIVRKRRQSQLPPPTPPMPM